MQTICFITGNEDKLRVAESILGFMPDHKKIDLDEIQGVNPDSIAEHKARHAWDSIKQPVTWDVSLHIDCLHGFPGPLVRWFWEEVGGEKICAIARLFNDQRIQAQTILTLFDGVRCTHFHGVVSGQIPPSPRGTNGFAWDPIFVPEGHIQTFAEMTPEEKNLASPHIIALQKLRDYLDSQ